MRIVLKSLVMACAMLLPSLAHAQSIMEGSDAEKIKTLIRVNLCEQTCKAGFLTAQRYARAGVSTNGDYKLYVVTTRNGRQCSGPKCARAVVAINRNDVVILGENYGLDPKTVKIPARITQNAAPQNAPDRTAALCAKPGRQLNSALIKQLFEGKTLKGINQKRARWEETLQRDGKTRLITANGKRVSGQYQISKNNICFKYGNGKWSCKAVYECTTGEGAFVFADQQDRLTAVITEVVAQRRAPAPQAEAVSDPTETAIAGLAECRALGSEIRRLRCYDALADQFATAQFGREERRELLRLMNFEAPGGRVIVETQLDRCDLNVFVDVPQARRAFSNETFIDLRHLDVGQSGGLVEDGTALFTFVSSERASWREIYTDRSRGTQRDTQKREATLPVAARDSDLAKVEKLIVAAAKRCQRG